MAATTKQRLSDMLDADLSKADVQDMMEDDPTASKPSTFSDWLQVASIEDMKASLKSLLDVGNGQALEQMKIVLEEDRAHQDWVENQEKAWKESKDKDEPMLPASKKEDVEPLMDAQNVQSQVKYIPLRLTAEERGLLGILEGALYVSEYTDQVDVYHTGSKAKRMALQIQQVCAILAGLVVANNFDVARRPLMERSFADNHYFFRMVFEIGRRYKILNPDKLRGSYGKLIHMLQDSVKGEVERQLDFNCVGSVKTVWSVAKGNPKALAMLQDPLLTIATKEIYTDGKSRAEVALESKDKAEALVELKRKYAEKPPDGAAAPKAAGDLGEALRGGPKRPELEGLLTEERIETIVASISDYFAFLRFNREPVDRMIGFLRHYFNPKDPGKWGLDIYNGRGGSCLSHSHKTQYTFVLQSLLLWREIMGNMFYLWQMTEEDLLDENSTYRLCDTGQGLNRVQHAPRVSRAMHQILHKVQSEVGNWVGLSVVHLGDRDVPNALVFIDKYTQVPRILGGQWPFSRLLLLPPYGFLPYGAQIPEGTGRPMLELDMIVANPLIDEMTYQLRMHTPRRTNLDPRWFVLARNLQVDEITGEISDRIVGWSFVDGFGVAPCAVTARYGAIPSYTGWLALTFKVPALAKGRFALFSAPESFELRCPDIKEAGQACEPYQIEEHFPDELLALPIARTLNLTMGTFIAEGQDLVYSAMLIIVTPEALLTLQPWELRVLDQSFTVVDAHLEIPSLPFSELQAENPTVKWLTMPQRGEAAMVAIQVIINRRIKTLRMLVFLMPEGFRHDIQHANQLANINKNCPVAIEREWRDFSNLRSVRIFIEPTTVASGTFEWQFPVIVAQKAPINTEWYVFLCDDYSCRVFSDPSVVVVFPVPDFHEKIPAVTFDGLMMTGGLQRRHLAKWSLILLLGGLMCSV